MNNYSVINSKVHPLNRYINQALPSDLNNQLTSTSSRTRITRACDHCKLRKTKCDSTKPRCSQCVKRGDPCTFTIKVCKRGPKPKSYNYPYSSSDNLQTMKKSTNVYPYPSYFHSQVNSNSESNAEYNRPSYSQQTPNLDSNLSEYSDSSSIVTTDFELFKLPPIQLKSPLFTPSNRFNNTSLMLPSISSSIKLPSIRTLLDECKLY